MVGRLSDHPLSPRHQRYLHRWLHGFLALLLLSLSGPVLAQATTSEGQALIGEWQFTTVALAIPTTERLHLMFSGDDITGSLYRNHEHIAVKGTLKGQEVRIEFKTGERQHDYRGKITTGGMSGRYTITGDNETVTGTWGAQKAPANQPASPRVLYFNPSQFHRQLSADSAPGLRIWPGDTVRTWSLDCNGRDKESVRRIMGSNPLTGPFYVNGAMPGDVLAVTIKHLRLNRDWAMSDSSLVARAVDAEYASRNKQTYKEIRWRLNADKQVATLENPPSSLRNLVLHLRLMLGCVGVAPGPGVAPVSTEDSGDVGGNLDFSGITEGATLYLQVNQPGALLYLGDAHALQGDGELTGNALETSMDIEFSVAVEREKRIGVPRVEDNNYIMAIGLSGSLDHASQLATSELANWLQSDYKLGAAEVAILLGAGMEYRVSELADRNVGIVAQIRKSSLTSLPRAR
jgi:amidase